MNILHKSMRDVSGILFYFFKISSTYIQLKMTNFVQVKHIMNSHKSYDLLSVKCVKINHF